MKTVEQRFWAKVDKNGPVPAHRPELGPCWVWTAALNTFGYGEFTAGIKQIKAHRYSAILSGMVLGPKKMVCHHCDNPKCVNPKHFFLGTNQENQNDCRAKGRTTHGIKNPSAKLSEDNIRDIRAEYARGGVSHRELAEKYGVTQTPIARAISGETWSRVA